MFLIGSFFYKQSINGREDVVKMHPVQLGTALALIKAGEHKVVPENLAPYFNWIKERYYGLQAKNDTALTVDPAGWSVNKDLLEEEQIDFFIRLLLCDGDKKDCLKIAQNLNDNFAWFEAYSIVLRRFIQVHEENSWSEK